MAAHLFKLSLALILAATVQSYVRVCYYTNWSQYRNAPGKYFLNQHYEKGLCTHLIYSFGKVVPSASGHTIAKYEWNDEVLYKQMQALKREDPSLKTLLAIGGWNHGSRGFKEMVANKENRKKFVANSLAYIKKYGFDGLDLDWEYPAARGSPAGDRQRFSDLCEELSAAYKPHRLLVTAAVKASVDAVNVNYEVGRISKSLDFINLMTYDFHGSWEKNTGHHTNTHLDAGVHTLHKTVNAWLSAGASPDKLVLGLASYGRSFKLKDKCNYYIGAPADKGKAGRYTREGGFLAYYEICTMKFDNHVCTSESSVKAPYGSADGQWVGYDDQESIVYKINNVMKRHNLKGYMFWALDLDDFTGSFCGQGRYPLMNAAKRAASGQSVSFQCSNKKSCDTTPPPPTPTGPTTKPPVIIKGKCRAYGPWKGNAGMDEWCNQGNHCELACTIPCTASACETCTCDSGPTPTTTETTTKKPTTTTTTTTTTTKTTTTTTKRPGPKKYVCKPKFGRMENKYYCNYFCQESCENLGKYGVFLRFCSCH